MRLVDADVLMATLGITDMDCNKCAWCDKEWSRCKRGSDFEDACCAIENAPTIEERKGKWIREKKHYKDSEQEFYYYEERCSECGTKRKIGWAEVRYCPNCGAKMKGEKPG